MYSQIIDYTRQSLKIRDNEAYSASPEIIEEIFLMASGGFYSTIYINNSQSLNNHLFVHWTQLSEY